MLFSALIIFDTIVAVKLWTCVSPVREAYSRVNGIAILQFSADLTYLNSPRLFEVSFYDGTPKARVRYNADRSTSVEALPGFRITGDTAGNVVVTLNDVQENNAGIYKMASPGFPINCNCLYILGTPEKPTVTLNKTPSVGESATLACRSTSTTTPANHSLSINYTWKVNNRDNPGGTKYTYSFNRNKLTVNNIGKDDANIQFICVAKENATDGFTSISSDPFSFTVYYGPDSARVNVTSPYNLKEGDILAIECIADCYPGCSYTWTNVTSGSVIRASGALLYLESVDKYMSGDYKCTSKNTGASYMKSTDTISRIYVKERTLVKWFYIGNNHSQSFITVNEQDVDVTFTCKISGDPAENVRVMFKGNTLKLERNTNSLIYILDRATCLDNGVYECEGRSNEMEISNRNVSLLVRCSPRPFRKTRENITSSLDMPITLTFEVLAYPEPGQRGYTWYRERDKEWLQILSNKDIQIFSSELVTNLTIFNVSGIDFGQYRVTAENVVGSYHQYFHLLPQEATNLELSKDDSICGNTLTPGIVLGVVLVIAISYAATITILWKRNVSISKNRCATCTGRDKGDESKMQLEYVNIANTSNEEHGREPLPFSIGSEVADGDDSNKTQYTELDIISRGQNDNTYDIIKRE